MRLPLLVLSMALIAAAPAHAHTRQNSTRVTWEATPCAAACASWIANGFDPCGAPFPPGGYADVVTHPAPSLPEGKVGVLEATLDQSGQWEPFICDAETGTQLDSGTHRIGDPCGFRIGPQPVTPFDQLGLGCHLDMATAVRSGRTYVLRAYNFLSIEPAVGRYWYLAI